MRKIYILNNISFLLNNMKIYIFLQKNKKKIEKTELKTSNKIQMRFLA
jgi:hypothetical protein